MTTGTLELHWERERYGALSLRLYDRLDSGQLTLLAAGDFGPFDGPGDVSRWLTRALSTTEAAPAR